MARCPHLSTRVTATYDPKAIGPQDPRVICDGCGERVGTARIERDERGGYIIVAEATKSAGKTRVPA